MCVFVCFFFFLNIALIELGSHRQRASSLTGAGAVFGAAPAPVGAGGGGGGNSDGQSEATTKEKPLKQLKTKPPQTQRASGFGFFRSGTKRHRAEGLKEKV